MDSYTNKLAQTTSAPPIYQHQQEMLSATPPGQAVQSVAQPKEQARKYGVAWVMDYLKCVLFVLEMLFLLRFGLKLLGVDSTNPFAAFHYTLTGFFLFPFEGPVPVVPNLAFGPSGTHSFEWTMLVAMAAYALLFHFVKLLLHTTISSMQEPMQYTEKYEIHFVGECEQSNDSSEGNPVQEISLQSRGNKFHIGSPILSMKNESNQMEGREIRTDNIASSITDTGEREFSLVNQQFGDYALIRQLGRGGYGSVYLGMHHYLKTSVALKLPNLFPTSEQIVKHFEFEAGILARLHHRHIVRMLSFGWEESIPFMVMEYAPGGTLKDYFPPQLPLPVSTVLPVVLQMASALQYLHNHGLVHCDVKPENMLLGSDEVWLSDFGTVQSTAVASSTQVSADELVGTPIYLAPERIYGSSLPASDQYALAVMAYQWLCGREPFQGTMLQVSLQHLEMPPPRLRDLVPSISCSVEQVVLKALSKDPQQRFAHVQEFAHALKQASQVET